MGRNEDREKDNELALGHEIVLEGVAEATRRGLNAGLRAIKNAADDDKTVPPLYKISKAKDLSGPNDNTPGQGEDLDTESTEDLGDTESTVDQDDSEESEAAVVEPSKSEYRKRTRSSQAQAVSKPPTKRRSMANKKKA